MIKFTLVTLGCAKNTADSETLKGILVSKGFIWEERIEKSDIIIINTCGFIKDAKEESIETIFRIIYYKKDYQKVVVLGCLAQRYANTLIKEIPEIDGIIGNSQLENLPEYIQNIMNGKRILEIKDINEFYRETFHIRSNIEKVKYSFIKIAEGCNNYCNYCVIPFVRGKYRSKLPEDVINEVRFLVDKGIKEVILVAQDIGLYGSDIDENTNLPLLLNELCKIDDLHWIRLLYCYPNHLTEELLYTIANQEKICNYLDIPLQHLSDSVLKRMGRKFSYDDTTKLIKKIKQIIPDIAIRSTFIVGFPGETVDDFKFLLDGLKELELTWCGFFKYSREEGTPAASMSNQIPEKLKQERLQQARELQEIISKEQLKKFTNKKMIMMVEEKLDDPGWYLGRSYLQSPEVDGQIYVKLNKDICIGDKIPIKIIGTTNYDLIGEVVDESC